MSSFIHWETFLPRIELNLTSRDIYYKVVATALQGSSYIILCGCYGIARVIWVVARVLLGIC